MAGISCLLNSTVKPTGDDGPNDDAVGVQILNASIGSIGIIGNSLVIFVLLINWKSFQSLTHMFILHQSAVDFISAFIFLNLRIDRWQPLLALGGAVGKVACKLWHSEYILWALSMTSTLNLTLLTTERYFAVVHPVVHRNRFTRSRVKIAMCLVWTAGFGYQAYLPINNELSATGSCVLAWTNENTRVFVGVTTFLVEYLIPLAIMLIEYLFIAVKLHQLKQTRACPYKAAVAKKTSKLTSKDITILDGRKTYHLPCASATPALSQPSNSEHHAVPTQRNDRHHNNAVNQFSRAFRNVIKTVSLVFITFVICWTPSEFTYLYYNLGGDLDFTGTLHRVSVVLVLCNMCVNPFIYALQYREFQMYLRRMVCLNRKQKCNITTSVPSILRKAAFKVENE